MNLRHRFFFWVGVAPIDVQFEAPAHWTADEVARLAYSQARVQAWCQGFRGPVQVSDPPR